MGCGQHCSKYFLILLNACVFIVGGVFFVAGVLLKVDTGLLSQDAIDLLNNIEYNSVKLGNMASALAYIMMFSGGILMLIAILGICGAWKKIKCCLLIYIVVVVFLILIQATAVGLWLSLRSKADEWLQGKLQTQLNSYVGPQETDTVSKGFNSLFMDVHCCGVTGAASDFTTSTWYTSRRSAGEHIPATCCQGVDDNSISTYVNSATCTLVPAKYYTQGCYNAITDYIERYSLIIIISCAVVLIVQVLAIIGACIVMDKAKNKIRHSGDAGGGKKSARPPPYNGIDTVIKTKKR